MIYPLNMVIFHSYIKSPEGKVSLYKITVSAATKVSLSGWAKSGSQTCFAFYSMFKKMCFYHFYLYNFTYLYLYGYVYVLYIYIDI